MKKRNLFIIAGLLFIVLIAMCGGIYYIIKHTDDIKKGIKEEEQPVNEQKKVALYTSRGMMQIYGDYLVEINDNNLKIMDYKTNILLDQDFEDVKYLNTYYGIDKNIYVITSLNYEEPVEDNIYNFKLYKIDNRELVWIDDFNCEFMQLLYNDNKQVVGIALDDNEFISYDGRFLNLQGYGIKGLGLMGIDAFNFSYNNEKIILTKCSMNICSYAILDIENEDFVSVNYENIAFLSDGNYRVKENGKYGIVDDKGNEKIKCSYDFIDISNKDVIVLYNDKKVDIMNYNYEVLNKDVIDYDIQIPEDIDSEMFGNFNLIHTEYIGNKILVQYKNEKLYIIDEEGNTEVLNDIKSFSYDRLLEKIYIYDWTNDDMSDKNVKEIWNKDLENVSNSKKEIKFYDMTIIIDDDHQATILKDEEKVDEFYYDDELIITEKYFIYNNDLKEETYYYYGV